MKASELRIGNIVRYGGVNAKVSQIEHNYFQVETLNIPSCKEVMNREATPILLNEEWFVQLGFKQVRSCYLEYNGFDAGLDGNDFVDKIWTIRIQKKIFIKVKYVHQLQNLYFALTGEELTLKNEL